MGLNPSDGRYAVSNDRVTHAALGGARKTGEFILYGFTRKPAASLAPLARSWNHPPALVATAGCASDGYDKPQRAYMLSATGPKLSFTLDGAESSPIVNACFVIRNWKGGRGCRVKIDEREVPIGKTCRQGVVHDTDGRPMMIVFLELESMDPIRVEVDDRVGG